MYEKAIEINKFNAMAYNNLGNLYMQLGNLQKAEEIFLKGTITGYGKIFNNLGTIYIKENNLLKAEMYLKKGIAYSPQYTPLYLNLFLF